MLKRYAWLDTFLRAHSGVTYDWKEEWQWHRYLLDGKLFAALCQPDSEHKDYDCRPLLTVKCEPELAVALRAEYPEDILPGFYMNKTHWNTIFLDGHLSQEQLEQFCDRSYQLIFSKLTKKRLRELTEGAKEHPAIGWVLCHRWDSCARSGQSRRSVRKCSSAGFWLSFSQAAMISSSSPSPTSGTNTRLSAW